MTKNAFELTLSGKNRLRQKGLKAPFKCIQIWILGFFFIIYTQKPHFKIHEFFVLLNKDCPFYCQIFKE